MKTLMSVEAPPTIIPQAEQRRAAWALLLAAPIAWALTTTPGLCGGQPGDSSLIFPQLANGGGIRSEIILTNPGAAVEEGTIEFFEPSGDPWQLGIGAAGAGSLRYRIEPGGAFRLETDGAGPPLSGYLTVSPDRAEHSLSGISGYRLGEFEVSVPASSLSTRLHVFVEQSPGTRSGVAIVNPQQSFLQILLRLINSDGNLIASRILNLPARNQVAQFVDELFLGLGQFRGSLHLTTSMPIAVLGLRQRSSGSLSTLPVGERAFGGINQSFGVVTVPAGIELNGQGQNIDSLGFWEAPDPSQTRLYVTAKNNRLVEVWQFPFLAGEQPPLQGVFGLGDVNGVVTDQQEDLLFVTQASPSSSIYAFSIPEQEFLGTFGTVDLGREPNLDLLDTPDGQRLLFVTSDAGDLVYVFELQGASGTLIDQFDPQGPGEIETILADDFYGILYVPDEERRGGIFAFTPDGTPYQNCAGRVDCASQFAEDVFQADAEGILMYRCQASGNDLGTGFLVVSDQRQDATEFEFFDRITWEHLGSLRITGVSNTDGIASTQQPLPEFPLGLLAVVDDDRSVHLLGWDGVLQATGLSCP